MTYSEIILYARFSSREQAEGMSIARQIGEASEWCRANGHTPTRQILDEGRSGFHGHHRSVGALGEFEAEAAAGLHRGALLVVERIDRLTREGHSAIMSLINGLTANGVSVFTVKNNRLYRAGEEMSLVDAITTLVEGDLGHTESATKASRTASNWRIRRERAAEAGKAMSATVCPPWLKVVDGKYELDHDKVAILNQIFQMSDDGLGASVIVRELNKVGKPTGWSNRKRKDISTRWQRCEIVQLLANRAVIGERQDKRRINKQIELLEPVRGFYPVAVDPALFDRVRDAASVRKKVRGGAKSPKIANLLSGLVTCAHCGGKTIFRARYLYCLPALEGDHSKCSNRAGVRYCGKSGEGLEKALLDAVLHIAMDDRAFANNVETGLVLRQISEVKRELELADKRTKELWNSYAETTDPFIKGMAEDALKGRNALAEKLAKLEKTSDKARGRADSAEHLRRIADIRGQMDDPKIRLKVSHALHTLIEAVWIDDQRNATVAMAGGLAALVINDGKVINQANAAIMFKDGDYRALTSTSRNSLSSISAAGERLRKTLTENGAFGFAGAADAANDYGLLKLRSKGA
jgi:DNA invertase Pin-like site-specific DNA recombinase